MEFFAVVFKRSTQGYPPFQNWGPNDEYIRTGSADYLIYEVDVDTPEGKELAQKLDITGTPTVVFFEGMQEGGLSKSIVRIEGGWTIEQAQNVAGSLETYVGQLDGNAGEKGFILKGNSQEAKYGLSPIGLGLLNAKSGLLILALLILFISSQKD